MSENMAEQGEKISEPSPGAFSLSLKGVSTKKSAFDKKLIRDVEVKEETDFVTEISDRTIKSSRQPEKRQVFVVPKQENDHAWRKKLKLKYGTLDDREIKEESLNGSDHHIKLEPRSPSSDAGRSAVASSLESDLNLVGAPTLENYEAMPVREFGMAMLRGMGFNPEEAEKQGWPKSVEIKIRPKGLGLGAETETKAQREHTKRVEKENGSGTPLIVKSGAYVKILRGAHEGKYGQVEGFNEDAGRVHICLAISKEKVSCNEAFVGAVTREEYNDRGKCLNREKYDDYKRQHETSQADSKFDVSSLAQSPLAALKEQKKKKNVEKQAEKRPFIGYWLRSQIRVRIIDEKFKKGKYVNEKVVVEDVLSRDACLCRTDQGQLLEDVHMDMLETVLPRSSCQSEVPVVVVAGKYAGQMGHIIERDKKRGEAHVQFENDMSVHKLLFDYICEYVGDL